MTLFLMKNQYEIYPTIPHIWFIVKWPQGNTPLGFVYSQGGEQALHWGSLGGMSLFLPYQLS